MIIVADTSPVNYLIQIGSDRLLPILYRRIVIPIAVLEELADDGAPAIVRAWLNPLPSWVDIVPSASVADQKLVPLGKVNAKRFSLPRSITRLSF